MLEKTLKWIIFKVSLLLLIILASCYPRSSSSYFWNCREGKKITYIGYKEGNPIYKKIVTVNSCGMELDCSVAYTTEEIISGDNHQTNKLNYYICRDQIWSEIVEDTKENQKVLLLKDPIRVGNMWKRDQEDICTITNIFNSAPIFERRYCVNVNCDKYKYQLCEMDGLDINNVGDGIVESIKEITY